MKKMFVLLIAILAIGFIGCDNGSGGGDNGNGNNSPKTATVTVTNNTSDAQIKIKLHESYSIPKYSFEYDLITSKQFVINFDDFYNFYPSNPKIYKEFFELRYFIGYDYWYLDDFEVSVGDDISISITDGSPYTMTVIYN